MRKTTLIIGTKKREIRESSIDLVSKEGVALKRWAVMKIMKVRTIINRKEVIARSDYTSYHDNFQDAVNDDNAFHNAPTQKYEMEIKS